MPVQAVSGLGVPVGAFGALSPDLAPVGNHTGGQAAVPATWSYTTPHREQHTACVATTKAGGQCSQSRAMKTEYCVGHLNAIKAMIDKGWPDPNGSD